MATAPVALPKLVKANTVGLESVGVSEAYLEKFIQDDPRVLGLGDLVVIERQRRQDKAGRLDLLLQDISGSVRYEVELMLGPADESHLIRTVEYWDIERRRYPAYEHRAVLIAEDIATRFLNVITLFSGSIPIIAIQVDAVTIGEHTGVTFLRVVDSTKLRKDDRLSTAEIKSTDRNEWVARVGKEMIELADRCLGLINQAAKRQRKLNYNKYFIGLTDGVRSNNFVWFEPKKSFLRVNVHLDAPEAWTKGLEEAGLDFKTDEGQLKINLTATDFDANRDLVGKILQNAVMEDEKE